MKSNGRRGLDYFEKLCVDFEKISSVDMQEINKKTGFISDKMVSVAWTSSLKKL